MATPEQIESGMRQIATNLGLVWRNWGDGNLKVWAPRFGNVRPDVWAKAIERCVDEYDLDEKFGRPPNVAYMRKLIGACKESVPASERPMGCADCGQWSGPRASSPGTGLRMVARHLDRGHGMENQVVTATCTCALGRWLSARNRVPSWQDMLAMWGKQWRSVEGARGRSNVAVTQGSPWAQTLAHMVVPLEFRVSARRRAAIVAARGGGPRRKVNVGGFVEGEKPLSSMGQKGLELVPGPLP